MPYLGPPMRRDVPIVAIELARLTGLRLVAIESYADGEVSDPAVVHLAVSGRIGERPHPDAPPGLVFLDAKGARDYGAVVADLFGATFGFRDIAEAEAMALADGAAPGALSDGEARTRAAEVSASLDAEASAPPAP